MKLLDLKIAPPVTRLLVEGMCGPDVGPIRQGQVMNWRDVNRYYFRNYYP